MSRIGVSCPNCGEQLRIESTTSTGSSGVSNAMFIRCPKCSVWFNPTELPERIYMLVDGVLSAGVRKGEAASVSR